LQGGIHPDFDGDYYIDVALAVKAVAPQIHVHGFHALEVTEGARRLEMPLADYLTRLKEAGLAYIARTAAEILDDEIRAIICPDKVNTRSGSRRTHRTFGWSALERSPLCSERRTPGARRAPPRSLACTPEGTGGFT